MKRRDIIIVTTSVIAAIACISLTFWGNLKNNGILTTDAFIGIVATFIGICATIIVGVQIASYIELRETRRQVEELERERNRLEKITSDIQSIRTDLANAFVSIYQVTEYPEMRAISVMMAICVDEKSDLSIDTLAARYRVLEEAISEIEQNSMDNGKVGILKKFNKKLKMVTLPVQNKDYEEIITTHFSVIARIDKLPEVE